MRKEKSIQSFSKYVETKNKHKEKHREPIVMGPYRCTGINIGPQLPLRNVYSTLKKDYAITCFCDDSGEFEVLHVQYEQKVSSHMENLPVVYKDSSDRSDASEPFKVLRSKDAFLFKEGSIVCWGMDKYEEDSWREQIKQFVTSKTSTIIEEMNVYRGHTTAIHADNIILNVHSKHNIHNREMLAYSFAIARSLFLESIEEEIGRGKNSIMKRVLATPTIIKQGKLPSRHEWTKITGEQMELRCKLNLNSTLLDVPDLFWEDYDMGLLFQDMQENLEIPDRIETLNKRLDMIEQIISSVQSSLTDKYSHKLEVIIIILIAIEVILYLADKNNYWRNLRWSISDFPHVIQKERNENTDEIQ